MSAFLLDSEAHLVRHAVGFHARRIPGYRNHYSCEPGSDSDRAWSSLVGRGLAVRLFRPDAFTVDLHSYAATEEACRLAGLSEAAIVRAYGSRERREAQHARYMRDCERRRERARMKGWTR